MYCDAGSEDGGVDRHPTTDKVGTMFSRGELVGIRGANRILIADDPPEDKMCHPKVKNVGDPCVWQLERSL